MTHRAVRTTTAIVFGLFAIVSAVAAADAAGTGQSAQAARFSIIDMRLQAAPQTRSIDHRFDVAADLRAAPDAAQYGGAFELNARLVSAVATACTPAGVLFANGFE